MIKSVLQSWCAAGFWPFPEPAAQPRKHRAIVATATTQETMHSVNQVVLLKQFTVNKNLYVIVVMFIIINVVVVFNY